MRLVLVVVILSGCAVMPVWSASTGPDVAVAWNVTVSGIPGAVARMAFGPVLVPNIQKLGAATPSGPDETVSGCTKLPPRTGTNDTRMPATAFPAASVTRTAGRIGTCVFASAVWLSPAASVILTAAPGVAVAVNVAGLAPATLARSVFVPAVEPSVQLPSVATPSAPDVAGEPVTLPPPAVVANDTAAPATALPYWSRTATAGATETGVLCTAV